MAKKMTAKRLMRKLRDKCYKTGNRNNSNIILNSMSELEFLVSNPEEQYLAFKFVVGFCCDKGLCRDAVRDFLKPSSEKEYVPACFDLANIGINNTYGIWGRYESIVGLLEKCGDYQDRKEEKTAREILVDYLKQEAITRNNMNAIHRLALAYINGDEKLGLEPDSSKAEVWLEFCSKEDACAIKNSTRKNFFADRNIEKGLITPCNS